MRVVDGGGQVVLDARPVGLQRQFLHAAMLGFTHPASGERLSFESELPPDLAAALELARTKGP